MKIFKWVERITETIGKIYSYTIFFLMLVVLYEVVMRYIFNDPTGWAYDTAWMLYGIVILGGAYTLKRKGHVRIDILQRFYPKKVNKVLEIMSFSIVILIPMLILTYEGIKYASLAWITNEKLSTTVWFFPAAPIKTLIPIGFGLVALQSIVEFFKIIKKN